MELSLFAIIVLLVVILYTQSEKFTKLDSELNVMKKKLDLLLEKSRGQDPVIDHKISARPDEFVKKKDALSVSAGEEIVIQKEEVSDNDLMPAELVAETVPVSEKTPVVEDVPTIEQPRVIEEITAGNEDCSDVKVPFTAAESRRTIKEQTETPVSPVPISSKKEKKNINYEKFIGENLFGKIGILVLVVGIGLFVKYAIDKDWINETMRTILGFVSGFLLLFIAERVRKKYRTFSSLLAGGAFAVFYLTVAIAFHYYNLFSQTAAFVILVCVTLLMSVLAILYDRRELAVIALAGGFIAPFLVSQGEGNYIFLFTYLTILNLGMFGLSLYKKWAELPVISFAATYFIFLLYIFERLIVGHVPPAEQSVQVKYLFVFATLFYFVFLLPVLTILKTEGKKLNKWLLSAIVANNFIYLFSGVFFLNSMQLPFKATGLLSLFIAIVNLILVIWLRRSKQGQKVLIYTMLGLVVTFVSITIPIQMDGNYITLFWASEMVLLLWLYIKSGIRVYESFSLILLVLTLISFLMDVEHQMDGYYIDNLIFINSMFVTCLFTGLAAGAYALLIAKYRNILETARYMRYAPWNAIMLVASLIILYYTFMAEFYYYLSPVISGKVMHLFTASCILALCYGLRKRFPVKRYAWLYIFFIGANVVLYLICVWDDTNYLMEGIFTVLLPWLTGLVVIASLVYVGRLYYCIHGFVIRFTVYLSVISTLLWLAVVQLFLQQLGLPDEYNAGFSIALAVAGFIQMALGMRLHQKSLRMVSLFTLGLVLAKLVLVDMWAMPTVGKIVVFVMLGVILLVLSFLYQKLKDVLFKDDKCDPAA